MVTTAVVLLLLRALEWVNEVRLIGGGNWLVFAAVVLIALKLWLKKPSGQNLYIRPRHNY